MFYEPSYLLPKAQIDAVGRCIDRACRHPSKGLQSKVPDEAIDQCEASYEAADGQKQRASTDAFDDTGLMALICHRDIPLFLANIDTPGEQQKYSIALIEHLFTLLPYQANVIVLYDVGCVLAHLLSQVCLVTDPFPVLNASIYSFPYSIHLFCPVFVLQLQQCTLMAMNGPGQLVYNPHLISGLGLSDGEGAERLWSCFIKLIGIERVSSVSSYQTLSDISSLLLSVNATSGSLITMWQSLVMKCTGSLEIGLGAVSRRV